MGLFNRDQRKRELEQYGIVPDISEEEMEELEKVVPAPAYTPFPRSQVRGLMRIISDEERAKREQYYCGFCASRMPIDHFPHR